MLMDQCAEHIRVNIFKNMLISLHIYCMNVYWVHLFSVIGRGGFVNAQYISTSLLVECVRLFPSLGNIYKKLN
jgi:hypothetical protein